MKGVHGLISFNPSLVIDGLLLKGPGGTRAPPFIPLCPSSNVENTKSFNYVNLSNSDLHKLAEKKTFAGTFAGVIEQFQLSEYVFALNAATAFVWCC